MNKKIVISIVCYDNVDEVISYASQVEKQSYVDNLVLLVTCNSCKNPNELENNLHHLRLESYVFFPKTNLGYLKGCIFGFEQYRKKREFDWGIISNTDMTFLDNSFLEKMFSEFDDQKVFCLAPNIIRRSNGRKQNPFLINRPSKTRINLWRLVYSNILAYKMYFYGSHIRRTLQNKEVKETDMKYIYAPHGSFFALNYECICELIKEQADIFMLGEEILVGEIVKENKGRVYYLNWLKIMHNENETTKFINDINKQKWSKESMEYLYKRFFR